MQNGYANDVLTHFCSQHELFAYAHLGALAFRREFFFAQKRILVGHEDDGCQEKNKAERQRRLIHPFIHPSTTDSNLKQKQHPYSYHS